MQIGVIGVGRMGTNHVRICKKLKNATLIGCCDIIKEKADEAAKEYNIKPFYDYKKMILEVDAVIVATQTIYHYDITKFCIENGKHVLIEKPMTLDVSEGKELIKLANEKGVHLSVGHVERFNPVVETLNEIFEPSNTIAMSVKRMSPMDHRVKDIDVVLDLMIHDIDIILFLMKGHLVTNIEATGRIIRKESMNDKNCDYAVAHIQFDNGVIAELTASRVTEKKVRSLMVSDMNQFIELDYMNKKLTINEQFKAELNSSSNTNKLRYQQQAIVQDVLLNTSESLLEEDQNFVDAINNLDSLKVTGEEAVLALDIVNKIREKIYEKLII
ncbi:Gfo/Idh/MocA family oxidoreductase [Clostridium sp. MB40-C1]|uniref:Gfo/Idh/MocA family protein n=1 Tax=Clostridium sp. MB40-C1 TaxID=3070996 RepID=UPI0027E0DBC1|nr:Gfo/Idh/MocA family oxidoreductase [Clostridium sp. MB40-C1]WMJ81315.1 Gfo/Idh/MocA family oxidoreductase [Clostridium sp. MB40-C1]